METDPALAVEIATLSQQRAIYDAIEKGESEIQEFYKGATIFITGGSGFIGKQLIEKLIRSCEIKKIYLLLRPKKGKTVQERLEQILKDPVYDGVKKKCPDFAEKLVAVPGDVSELRLGISDQDWRIITDEVDIIIHVAATVNFDETLKTATLINVRGTREVIRLGHVCKKIRSMVHVSTAFAHATKSRCGGEVSEAFYDSPVSPGVLIDMAENIDMDRLHDIMPHIIKDWPNTYTFTKAVAEEAVRTLSGNLPISVVRPAIVIGSFREPSPGWLDFSCAYGPSGLILGVGVGIMHVLYGVSDNRIDLVPVDEVNNAIIAAGWWTGTQKTDEKTVYTVTSTRNPVTWHEVTSKLNNVVKPYYPTPRAVYYPFYVNASNKLVYMILSFFFHMVPAYFIDALASCLGKSTSLKNTYRKADKLTLVLSYFTCNNWKFLDNNLMNLYKKMSETDRIIYNFDITTLDWNEQILIWAIGIRKYLVQDGLKDSGYALKKLQILKLLNYIVVPVYCYLWYNVLHFIVYGLGFVFKTVFSVIGYVF